MIRPELITSAARLTELTPAWRQLSAGAHEAPVARCSYWCQSWWRVFGGMGGRQLRSVAFWRGERLVGLAPLLVRPVALPSYERKLTGWRQRLASPFRILRLEPLGAGEPREDEICSEYLGLTALAGEEQAVARAFARQLEVGALGVWHELLLPAMSAEDAMVALLYERLQRLGEASLEVTRGAPFVALPNNWEAYLAARSNSQRYRIRRALRRFERWSGGDHQLHHASNADELEAGVRILKKLHNQRWSSVGHAGVFISERFRNFHQHVMPQLLNENALSLSWMMAHGRPIAAHYSFISQKRVQFYQAGRAMDLPKQLPIGQVMHLLNIRRAIEMGCREYDFLAGVRRYKMELANEIRPIVQLRLLHPSSRTRAYQMGKGALTWLRGARQSLK